MLDRAAGRGQARAVPGRRGGDALWRRAFLGLAGAGRAGVDHGAAGAAAVDGVPAPGLWRRGDGQRRVRLAGHPAVARRGPDQPATARAAVRRGAAALSARDPGRGADRVAGRAARPGGRPGPVAAACRPGAGVDRRRVGGGRPGVEDRAGRAVPPAARPLAHPLPHRVAAPTWRRGCCGRPSSGGGGRRQGRLQLRGGVQPSLQTSARHGADVLAGRPATGPRRRLPGKAPRRS